MKKIFIVLLLTCLCLFFKGNYVEAGVKQPNIVFILIDDLRPDVLGYDGHPFMESPSIDRLAREGIQFQNAFVTTSLCSPARASFMTGMYMHHHDVVDNNNRMKKEAVVFPKLLQKVGYQTAFIGKWHMGGSSDEPRSGFDHWVSFKGQGTYFPKKNSVNVNGKQFPRKKYMTDELTDYAEDWLSQQDGDKPFMLYLSHKGVHGPYHPAERHRDQFKNKKSPLVESMENSAENYSKKPMWVKNQRNSWHGVDHPYHGQYPKTIEEMNRHYCEMLLSIDDSVKRVMDTLKRKKLDENTIVIFTSDGGFLWGEHGLIDKRCAYEESIRIPFLVWAPKIFESQRKVEQLVCNIDVAPTLLELANSPVPENMDGISFAKFLTDKEDKKEIRKLLLYEYYWEYNFPQTPTTFALRNNRYKLIQYHGIWDTDELYDLKNDPKEMKNLINDSSLQGVVKSMRRELFQELKKSNGLSVKFGHLRSHRLNRRNVDGSKAAGFPNELFDKPLK